MRWTPRLIAVAVVSFFVTANPSLAHAGSQGLPQLAASGEYLQPFPAEHGAAMPIHCCPQVPDCNVCDLVPGAYQRQFCLGPPWFVYGWLEHGFTANFDSPADRFNGPNGFNDRSNDYQVNQLYVTAGRRVDRQRCSIDVGGRVDLLFGSDYFFTQARGLEMRGDFSPRWNSASGPRTTAAGTEAALYGLAMPQLYAELFLPVGCGMNIQFGHFYTTLGYEAVQAPDNFFYSHSYTMLYGEPRTHTGVLARYDLSPCLEITAGLTNGWDNFNNNNGKLAFLGGVTWRSCDGCRALAFQLHTGPEDDAGQRNRTVYSLVYTRQFTQRLSYVFQHDLGFEEDAALSGNTLVDAHWYSINQYLYYRLNCCTELGLRVEWFRDDQNSRVLPLRTDLVRGGNYVDVSLGLNWRPARRLVIRPELRWDHSDVDSPALGVGGVYDVFRKKDQVTLAIDMIAHF